jgi:hypothetical protein
MQCYLERGAPAKAKALASQLHDRPALSLWHNWLGHRPTREWSKLTGPRGDMP